MNSSRDCERGVVKGAVALDTSVILAVNPVRNYAGITGAPAVFVLHCFSLARPVARVGGNGNGLPLGSISSAGNA